MSEEYADDLQGQVYENYHGYAPYNTLSGATYYGNQGYYQQPYFTPDYYGYNNNQEFFYNPNLSGYATPYAQYQNGASNYGYQDQWVDYNQTSTVPQSKSYRNNRHRGRQNRDNVSTHSSATPAPKLENTNENIQQHASSTDGGSHIGKEERGKQQRVPSKWDNSSRQKSRSTNNRQPSKNNYPGYQSQEFGAGYSRGNRGPRQAEPKIAKTGQTDVVGEVDENKPPDVSVKPKSNKKKISNKKQEKSDDVDQRTRMIEQLSRGRYECMVCCENMRPDTAVWNCNNCYHIFHLFCIKKWARSSTAELEGGKSTGWRCPGCQNITEKVPNSYKCFCGKVRDPVYNRFDTPHSCGDICNRNRKGDCPHPCTLLCHPGACPPCSATVTKSCDCGKIQQTVRCGLNIGLKCDEECGKTLNCGKHKCLTVCHSGPCQSCDQSVNQKCYGSHTSREVKCGSNEDMEMSYSCKTSCNKILACGNHRCEDECHPGDCSPCPLLPELVTHCPCGRTPLTDLTNGTRTSCLEPIPTCTKVCKKKLKCGPADRHHHCKAVCHEGECPPCKGTTHIRCRCKNIEKSFPCPKAATFSVTNPFLCEKKCTKKRLCGRHKCGDVCCVKEEHICEMKCNRKLNCGKHKCGNICHPGNCQPCYESSFDELTCHCGAEVIFPPVPCGTKPPECSQVCRRQHECDHKVRHNCHSEDVCPPCTELTERLCVGGHETRKNIPCHIKDIVCGYPCGKMLSCQIHKCKRTCHKGDCLAEGESCSQLCERTRPECGHPCGAVCHPDDPCPKIPCKTEIFIKCICGNRQAKIQCMLGGQDDITDYQKISIESWMNQGSVEISQLKKGAKRQLDCDADCARLERNRRLALALEIENPDLQSKLGSPPYPEALKDFARKNPEKATMVEKALYELVNNAKQSKYPCRSHSFPAMNRENRQFVHELAEFYGCETQSYDNEPKKNVVATAYRTKCYLPSVGITTFIQKEQTPTLAPLVKTPGRRLGSMTTLKSTVSKPDTSSKPEPSKEQVIDYFDFE